MPRSRRGLCCHVALIASLRGTGMAGPFLPSLYLAFKCSVVHGDGLPIRVCFLCGHRLIHHTMLPFSVHGRFTSTVVTAARNAAAYDLT